MESHHAGSDGQAIAAANHSGAKTHVLEPFANVHLIFTSSEVLEKRRELLEQGAAQLQPAKCHPATDIASLPAVDELVPGGDVVIKVSSNLLVRKSPVFEVFLREGSLHRHLLLQNGYVTFRDDDVDPEAFLALFRFMYDDWNLLPGFDNVVDIDFDTWVETLVIIDKYDLHKATFLLKREWWPHFAPTITMPLSDHLIRAKSQTTADIPACLSACHVMGKKWELQGLLKIYISCYTGFEDFLSRGLPLPDELYTAEAQRLAAFKKVNNLIKQYEDSRDGISSETVCNCNDPDIARKCDRSFMTHLTNSFVKFGWASPPEKTKSGRLIHRPLQIDPSKVTLNDVSNRVPLLRPGHYCAEQRKKSVKAAEKAAAKAAQVAAAQAALKAEQDRVEKDRADREASLRMSSAFDPEDDEDWSMIELSALHSFAPASQCRLNRCPECESTRDSQQGLYGPTRKHQRLNPASPLDGNLGLLQQHLPLRYHPSLSILSIQAPARHQPTGFGTYNTLPDVSLARPRSDLFCPVYGPPTSRFIDFTDDSDDFDIVDTNNLDQASNGIGANRNAPIDVDQTPEAPVIDLTVPPFDAEPAISTILPCNPSPSIKFKEFVARAAREATQPVPDYKHTDSVLLED